MDDHSELVVKTSCKHSRVLTSQISHQCLYLYHRTLVHLLVMIVRLFEDREGAADESFIWGADSVPWFFVDILDCDFFFACFICSFFFYIYIIWLETDSYISSLSRSWPTSSSLNEGFVNALPALGPAFDGSDL